MGILNKDEIQRQLEKGKLILKARRKEEGQFDIEPDSYDLTAGIAVWKSSEGVIETKCYDDHLPEEQQPCITVQPGQMIFVITREDIKLPLDICGAVYSRNNIALEGILALNAGHVDPGYQGPIVIRLINLRAVQWCLTLGESIFTIVFHTVDKEEGDKLISGPRYSTEEMLQRVRDTATTALSNALFDLYAKEIDKRLDKHYTTVQQNLRDGLIRDFIRRDEVLSSLFKSIWSKIIGTIIFLAVIGAAIFGALNAFNIINP